MGEKRALDQKIWAGEEKGRPQGQVPLSDGEVTMRLQVLILHGSVKGSVLEALVFSKCHVASQLYMKELMLWTLTHPNTPFLLIGNGAWAEFVIFRWAWLFLFMAPKAFFSSENEFVFFPSQPKVYQQVCNEQFYST